MLTEFLRRSFGSTPSVTATSPLPTIADESVDSIQVPTIAPQCTSDDPSGTRRRRTRLVKERESMLHVHRSVDQQSLECERLDDDDEVDQHHRRLSKGSSIFSSRTIKVLCIGSLATILSWYVVHPHSLTITTRGLLAPTTSSLGYVYNSYESLISNAYHSHEGLPARSKTTTKSVEVEEEGKEKDSLIDGLEVDHKKQVVQDYGDDDTDDLISQLRKPAKVALIPNEDHAKMVEKQRKAALERLQWLREVRAQREDAKQRRKAERRERAQEQVP